MNYQKVIIYLFETLPAFSKLGSAAFRPGLANIQALCEGLGNPQDQLRVIHVAGTNGKGSVSSMLASVLMEAGYQVGLNTSPHMLDFRERIRVNGECIPEDAVVDFVNTHKELIERVGGSFFEVSTAMAFWYFAREGVDFAVMETGMGGRFDATNIVSAPELCILTHIGLDHQQFLGETLAKIAFEKAGIIKEGVPVIVAERVDETQEVFVSVAAEKQASLSFAEDRVSLELKSKDWGSQTFEDEQAAKYTLKYLGSYQMHNLAAVITAVKVLRSKGWKIDQSDLENGVLLTPENTGLTGRLLVFSEEPLIIMDIGHNLSGVKGSMQGLLELAEKSKIHFVWGMMEDKDVSGILPLIPKNQEYYWVAADSPRALNAELLANASVDREGKTYAKVTEGVKAALAAMDTDEILFIGGSNYVVSEALQYLQTKKDS